MVRTKKYRVHWNRILFVVLIPIIIIFLIYFGFIKDYQKEHLIKIGYNTEEINSIRKKLSDVEIEKLYKYDYLSFLVDLVNTNDYKSENLLSYINYIDKIDGDYNLDNVVYLVNNGINYSYSEKLVNIVKNKYFIKSRLDRYMQYDNNDIDNIITNVNSNLDYEFYTNMQSTNIEKGILMIVNKYYSLSKDYSSELVIMDKKYSNYNGSQLNAVAYEAFKKLVDDAEELGYHIRNNSAYRSYETQENLYNDSKKNNGITYADKWSARAGHSEHQTGFALDVGVQTAYAVGRFESSREFTWMKENSYKYGFILRYPKGKEYITGYSYEPWHYRYVGVEVATYIYNNNITFEEYYAYFVENN